MSNPHPSNGFDKRPQDINSKGRPKKGNTITEEIQKALEKELADGKTKKQVFAERVVDRAIAGDPTCERLVLNYMDGMPIQQLKHLGDKEQPVRLIIGGNDDRQDGDTEDET